MQIKQALPRPSLIRTYQDLLPAYCVPWQQIYSFGPTNYTWKFTWSFLDHEQGGSSCYCLRLESWTLNNIFLKRANLKDGCFRIYWPSWIWHTQPSLQAVVHGFLANLGRSCVLPGDHAEFADCCAKPPRSFNLKSRRVAARKNGHFFRMVHTLDISWSSWWLYKWRIIMEMGSVHQSNPEWWFVFFLWAYRCSVHVWWSMDAAARVCCNVARRCKMTKHHKAFEYSRFCHDSMEWFWTGKDILQIVMDPCLSCLPGSIFDGIIGYLRDPDTGRSRFESAMFTYVIVMVLQGCFSCWAAQITETNYLL